MRRDQRGEAGATDEIEQHRRHFIGGAVIEIAGRLVAQEQLRPVGERAEDRNALLLTSGGFGEAPAKMNHYAWVTSETVVQVHGQGPFAITYVNPADDPRNRK